MADTPQVQKTYVGQRPGDDDVGDCRVYVRSEGGTIPLRQVRHHSPSGFEWGYGGSGPADTALSILADHFGERPTKAELYQGQFKAWPYHQDFKFAIVAKFPHDRWELTTAEINEWIAGQPLPDFWWEADPYA